MTHDRMLKRKECAAALAECGFPVTAATLATLATRGGGPKYHRWGHRVLYRWADALEWAHSRLGPAIASTAELDAGGRR